MRFPAITGIIERRILVNYRIDPAVLAGMLPAPFQPKTVRGHGIAGICLIRLRDIRPKFIPVPWGIRSENAAHRIAVEWTDAEGLRREGVFIPRRDTNSRFNAWAGGRIFPGEHHRASFVVDESQDRFAVTVLSVDQQTRVCIAARVAEQLPKSSIFESLGEASEFFETGAIGYSTTAASARLDCLKLQCHDWRVQPLSVEHVESSLFDNQLLFPKGTTSFDCGLLMRNIRHEWLAA